MLQQGVHLCHGGGVLLQQVHGPRQHAPRRLMACHQHGQQVIPQLRAADLVPGGNQEAQYAGIRLVDVVLPEPGLQQRQWPLAHMHSSLASDPRILVTHQRL